MSVDVIVVGAGVAGLTAARDLVAAGAEVVVVEARDRIGGRTWTHLIAGRHVDLGGSWIHGPVGNPLAAEVERLGLATTNDGTWATGMAIHHPRRGWLTPDVAKVVADRRAAWDPASLIDLLGRDADHRTGVTLALEEWDLTGVVSEAVEFSLLWSEGGLNVGGDPDSISLAGSAVYHDGGGGNLVVAGGYRTLVDRLAEGLDIRTGEPVLAVEHGGERVVVSTAVGSLAAPHVIVTVPLGVLQAGTIRFEPAIASVTAPALRLRMSTLEKVVLAFDERFWPDDMRRLTVMSDHRRFPSWVDLSAHAGAPTLVGFVNPLLADGLDDAAPSFRVEAAIDVLGSVFGTVPDPTATFATDWMNDPYSLGSYSHIPLGGSAADMRAIAEPVGERLAFAGEHTVPEYFGTVHAAFASGRRAAAWALGSGTGRIGSGT